MGSNTDEKNLRSITEDELHELLQNNDVVDLSNCYFNSVTISTKEGRISSFEGSRFYNCKFKEFDGQYINFQGAVMTDCDFESVNLNNANMVNSEIYYTRFKETGFLNTDLTGSRMQHVVFNTGTDFYQTEFKNSYMNTVYFRNTKAENIQTDFRTVNITMGGATSSEIEYHKQHILKALNMIVHDEVNIGTSGKKTIKDLDEKVQNHRSNNTSKTEQKIKNKIKEAKEAVR